MMAFGPAHIELVLRVEVARLGTQIQIFLILTL